jgi:hypothetical protein
MELAVVVVLVLVVLLTMVVLVIDSRRNKGLLIRCIINSFF